ncbi:MAG TPA: DNA-directed RNA polymerase subunit beta' [Candidatus Vogelbacteria bacterium]|nr:DNA-directed RNA polymerase subunit beta' [Candidatus Vogelbacteria bacterium]
MINKKNNERIKDFNVISLKLASPERILNWSYGEVTKPETINYRSGRSERGGLFDERIFGPEKDFECYCGKYKRIRYKDVVCEKCGVEVTRSIVRRERMGHIELASPVAHIWYLKSIPSRMSLVLGLPVGDLEKVIYFAGYLITSVNEDEKQKVLKEIDSEYKTKLKSIKNAEEKDKLKEALDDAKRQIGLLISRKVIDEITYHRLSFKYGSVFEASIGAEAIYQVFHSMDLEEELANIQASMEKAGSVERQKLQKRFNLIKTMKRSGVRPEWMFLKVLPVIPPALRPMVALDGGRHATSDVNDLYRRVINRNNRLKKLIDLNAPEVILRNEKRILQEAVDALLDNSIRQGTGAMSQAQRRPLKSLADNLRGKQGRFRQNLLGKRVDYSGRSVIVIGPELRMNECGLPKLMALELFRPFIISKILEYEMAFNIRGAGRLIDEGEPEVWAILEEVIKNKYVLLNRAPTLHRLSIQAFKPVLIEGRAIQIHPLVCTAFNADFDGDQMAVHVPLSSSAQREAQELIAANRNLLKPGSGDPIINMKLDIVLGCYYATKVVANTDRAEKKFFHSPNAAIMAYDFGDVKLQELVKVVGGKKEKYGENSGNLMETTIGRILFNNNLPNDYPFINENINGKQISNLVENLITKYGISETASIVDKIKDFGFKFSTISGITWGMDDVKVPEKKQDIVKEAELEAQKIEENFNEGIISDNERYRMIIEIWTKARNEIEKLIPDSLEINGSVADMINSNARGSISSVCQMSGMKGLIVNPGGKMIDFPIIPSYKEGLSPLEYFISTHGSRKGLADTALNTAKAGYMTRKLVDVAQDVVVMEEDCGDTEGKLITEDNIYGFDTGIGNNIRGRILLEDLLDKDGQIIFKKGHMLSGEDHKIAEEKGAIQAKIRTPLSCKLRRGVCQKCYGEDPSRRGLVKIGEAVGIVAAQAIGEPGTQLTMRTKHAGGVSTGADIVGGLPRVEELFERRSPKNSATISEYDGLVSEIIKKNHNITIKILIDHSARKKSGKKKEAVEYTVPRFRTILVKEGDKVSTGDVLTDGPLDLINYFKLAGKTKVEDYIIKEVSSIYELQGVDISRKHIELIIRQMMSRVKIKDPGDTGFTVGSIIDRATALDENDKVKDNGGKEAEFETALLGISESSLNTASFLSAVSFQHATRVLIDASIEGSVDYLRGLKENVIIGRLIPAGTGLIENYEEESNRLYGQYREEEEEY